MLIRKRSFFEIFFPVTILSFLGKGTRFIDVTHIATFRFMFLIILFLYFFLNHKILIYVKNTWWLFLLLVYLFFCVTTTLWSEVLLLSFLKSTMFALSIVTLISAGCFWVIKFGFKRSLEWLLPIVIITLISGAFGGKADDQIGDVMLYSGLTGNPNSFGILTAMVFPLLLWRCYCVKENKKMLFLWIIFLLMDVKFLFASFSRSSIVNILCVILFFSISLPFSKKILIGMASVFSLTIMLTMMPVSFLESAVMKYAVKGENAQVKGQVSDKILWSRKAVWQQSFDNAMKGGMMGMGFAATVGDTHFKLSGNYYGREKGNSQLAILEETGMVGLLLSCTLIFIFFPYAFSYYIRLTGNDKVIMGLVLGSILGLIAESFVEAWWDSLGPEVICFWTLIGVVFGIIYLKKRELYANMRSL